MILPFSFPNIATVDCYFQLRSNIDDTSDNISFECDLDKKQVLEKRRYLLAALDIELYCEVKQVHGNCVDFTPIIYQVNSGEPVLQEADGMSTDKENVALMIKTADCQPILCADISGRYIMALHVGWRGNAVHYIQEAIASFSSHYHVNSEDICVVRGPSLSPIMSEFIHAEDEFQKEDLCYFNPETKTMNLWKMTKMQLLDAGIREEHIYSIDLCTFSSPLLFSYRREARTGRQCSLIVIRSQ